MEGAYIVNTVGQGMARAATVDAPTLTGILTTLAEVDKRLNSLIGTAAQTAERLVGPQPEKSSGALTAVPMGSIALLEDSVRGLMRAADALADHLYRIDRATA